MIETNPISLPELLRQRAEAEPDRILIEETGGRKQTYAQFQSEAWRWSAALDRIGVQEQEVVATMFQTMLESYHCWIGLAWLRAVESAINNEYKGAMLERAVNGSGATVLVVSGRYLAQIVESAANFTQIKKLVLVGASELPTGLPFEVIGVQQFLKGVDPIERPAPGHWDKAGIIYTSGSTGLSKGVLVTWALLTAAIEATFPGDDPADYDDGAYFCPWQQYHMTGKTGLEFAGRLRLRLVLRDRFSVSGFWADVRTYRCTHFLLAFIAPWLWREPALLEDSDNPLRRVCMVPLIPEWREFGERFSVRVTSVWASTEAGFPLTAVDPPSNRAAGRVCGGYEVRLVDENDCEVAPGAMGELIVRHALPWRLSPGYYRDAEATAQVWRNGWLHTGDGFTRDSDGWYYFVDRLKDYIKYRGKSVSAAEVEREVVAHPDVIECACVGVPSDLSSDKVLGGEDIRIFIVTEPASTVSCEALLEFLANRMPKFMLPRYIDHLAVLPRNHVNKIAKPLLRARPLEPATWDREKTSARR